MTSDTIITILGSGAGGALLIKVIEIFLLPKEKVKEFDQTLRDELWDRIKNLEGRLDEQNKMIVEVIKENASVKQELHTYKEENTMLKAELDKHIKNN